ncbi:COMM domain-containing protein 8-like [Penaeus japonicus]|uniref:COMM domain-containing protein 8-like n=1 Tax=Penaeus japonicus TaxID=27405 RepID=UPI001C70D8B9|nr:COMM domain-containing protein 8-like [Penaeus japonicus]
MEDAGNFALTFVPSQDLIKFVHRVIDSICGGTPVSHKEFEGCPLDKFWLALQSAKSIIKDVSTGRLSKDESLQILSPLGQEAAGKLLSAVSVREDEIKKAIIQESLSGTVHLKDFDWNVRLAVASDKVLDLNESLMTLHLHTMNADKGSDTLTVEMSAEQVDRLIEQLKGAREKLTQVSNSR